MSTWYKLISDEMRRHKDGKLSDAVCTLTKEQLLVHFDDSAYAINGEPFTVWTDNRVYFPRDYCDGQEAVGSVSRHPDGKPTEHQ